MTHQEIQPNAAPTRSPFWPQFLLALSLTITFGWQTFIAARQYVGMVRFSDQQAVLVEQAAQAESKFQAMMTDLIKLAETDAEAKAIVSKYRITINNQGQPGLPGSKAAAIKEALPK